MQAGNADRSRELESNRYKETGKLISICMPPCMGKTIAAVFLRLSAASVKGFLSWLLLSALLLQLSEPVSDALLFGRSWRSALLFHLTLPFGKVTVVLFHNGFRLPIGRHECLHIGITVLPENIGELIQPAVNFLLRLLYRSHFATVLTVAAVSAALLTEQRRIKSGRDFLQALIR